MRAFLVYCPACEHEWREEGEAQGAEPDVGIHAGVALGDLVCPECKHEFTEEEREKEERRLYEALLDDDPY
jgi:uncharacterized Zn finger protein (UPF0148 family)